MTGLYGELVEAELLVPHSEADKKGTKGVYKIIQPEKIGFISYPYEWSFSQYKDAALTTLEIQRRSLGAGMSLKDATAYNIQFHSGQPVFIDTPSFEKYEDGKPWAAYKQFCQHFLAPLALMAHVDADMSKLMRIYIDGVPLPLASQLLPGKTKASSLLAHIHVHARSQQKYADKGGKAKDVKMSKQAGLGIISSLAKAVKKLEWNPTGTEWGDYYTFTNYDDRAFKAKQKLVEKFILRTKAKTVWDIGANDGSFSRLASGNGINTVAFDIDPVAVEKNYRQVKESNEEKILPLVMDLTNPSPDIGWANSERQSMTERGPADTVLALALVHHLAISNNLPLESIAQWLAQIGRNVIIEFVPKEDSQVQKLLSSREDIFDNYNEKGFEQAMGTRFTLKDKQKVAGSKRTLYLLKKK
jgi:ribosomal protein L11 methylase PrmA